MKSRILVPLLLLPLFVYGCDALRIIRQDVYKTFNKYLDTDLPIDENESYSLCNADFDVIYCYAEKDGLIDKTKMTSILLETSRHYTSTDDDPPNYSHSSRAYKCISYYFDKRVGMASVRAYGYPESLQNREKGELHDGRIWKVGEYRIILCKGTYTNWFKTGEFHWTGASIVNKEFQESLYLGLYPGVSVD